MDETGVVLGLTSVPMDLGLSERIGAIAERPLRIINLDAYGSFVTSALLNNVSGDLSAARQALTSAEK